MKYKVLVLYGKSGSGKDTIQNYLLNESDMKSGHKVISFTTRPPRDYEENGKDYFFISDKVMEIMIEKGFAIEYTRFNGWTYATMVDSFVVDKLNIAVLNPDGLRALIKDDRFEVCPVYIHVDDKTRLTRCLNREANPNCYEICRRYLADEEDFRTITDELNQLDIQHYTYNNDGENGVSGFLGFLMRQDPLPFGQE